MSAIPLGAAVVAGALLFGASAAVQFVRDQRYPLPTVSRETMYITSPRAVGHLTKGFNPLAADLYWIRTVQYFGGIRLGLSRPAASDPAARDRYELLHPMLDLTTSLDPHFNIAYRFGAIFLAEPYPGGAGRPDLAISLLEKGLEARADKWEYMWDIGFVHYWWRQDYQQAAAWFARASEVPGAPWFLQSLAATTLAEGGDRQSSRQMWESIRQSAEVDFLRRDAERKLAQLQAMDDIDALQRMADALRTARGATVSDWATLIRARRLPGLPLDPAGTPYEIDAAGRVSVSTRSPLYPLPTEPKRVQVPRA